MTRWSLSLALACVLAVLASTAACARPSTGGSPEVDAPAGTVRPGAAEAWGTPAAPAAARQLPRSRYPLDPDDLLYPVDKQHVLPEDYVPSDLVAITGVPATRPGLRLRQEAYDALKRMADDARAGGAELVVASSFRSFEEQAALFRSYAARSGEAEANRYSARPGYSEHQLGTTIDFTSRRAGYDLIDAFGETPEGQWLNENAFHYGFVMSYPPDKEEITGYVYEPWHFRYVGEEVAAEVRAQGITLHEYLLQ